MIKNITKVVMAGLLLTGAANAAELYSANGNTVTTNIKLQAYLVHDQLGFDQRNGSVDGVAPAEMTGNIKFETSYYRQFSDNFKVGAFAVIKMYPFGYSNGPYGGVTPIVDPNGNIPSGDSDRIAIDKAYVTLEHTQYGILQIGNIVGTYNDIQNYSDVDIFIGTPSTDLPSASFFGQDHTNGVRYQNTMLNDKLTLGVMMTPGGDVYPFTAPMGNVNFEKDFGVGAKAEYKLTDDISVGADYQGTYYRVVSPTAPNPNSLTTRKMSNMGIAGISYAKGATLIGATATYKNYKWNNLSTTDYNVNEFGFEAGASYDISGKGVGFRPSAQFDYLHRSTETKVASNSNTADTVQTMAAELGVSYYINPQFAYIAAAVLDLRSKDQIKKAQADNTKGVPNNYFGVGVLYNF
ncbi:hypothetical protein ACFX5K_05670 [Rickettsiales bacterium LUAb2]